MKKPALVATLILVSIGADADAQSARARITHEDVFTMKRTSNPKASPDGRWIVYTVSEPNYDPALAVSDLWIVPADGSSAPRRLTSSRRGEAGVVWSPDSQRLAFSTRRDGDESDQIYVLPVAGGEAQRVTSLASGASNPQWRPDGAALLVETFERPASSDKSTARAYDSMPARFWNTWLDGSRPRLLIQPLGGGPATDVLANATLARSPDFGAPFAGEGADRSLQAQWSPDGQEVVFAAYVNVRAWMTADPEAHLFRVRPGGEPVRMTSPGFSYDEPTFSPDGKALLARQSRSSTPGRIYSLARLTRFERPQGTPHVVTEGFDRSVGAFTLCSGGRVVFAAEDSGFSQLFEAALAGTGVKKLFDVREGGYGSPVCAGGRLFAMFGDRAHRRVTWNPHSRHRLQPRRSRTA
jgi:Tol biopolymer transport system component